MTTAAEQTNRYYVHLSDGPRGQGKVIEDVSAEAAALEYVEHAPGADLDSLSILVRDCDSGRQDCFVIDVASGAVSACD